MPRRARLAAARQHAQNLIDAFAIEDPAEILVKEMAICRGARVHHARLDGYLGRRVRRHLTVDSTIREPGRERFTLAHELGHYELHPEDSSCDEQHIFRSRGQTPQEREANAFASELLMPTSLFVPRCRQSVPNIELVRSMSRDFQTSLTATAMRIIETSPYPCALFLSSDKKILWSKVPKPFYRHQVKARRGALSGLSALRHFRFDERAAEAQLSPAAAWFENFPEEFELMEQSFFIRTYGKVLTMVWWPEPNAFQEALLTMRGFALAGSGAPKF